MLVISSCRKVKLKSTRTIRISKSKHCQCQLLARMWRQYIIDFRSPVSTQFWSHGWKLSIPFEGSLRSSQSHSFPHQTLTLPSWNTPISSCPRPSYLTPWNGPFSLGTMGLSKYPMLRKPRWPHLANCESFPIHRAPPTAPVCCHPAPGCSQLCGPTQHYGYFHRYYTKLSSDSS